MKRGIVERRFKTEPPSPRPKVKGQKKSMLTNIIQERNIFVSMFCTKIIEDPEK